MSAGDDTGSDPGCCPDLPAAPCGALAESCDYQAAPGWWQAADHRWYARHLHPNHPEVRTSAPGPREWQPSVPLRSVRPTDWSPSAAISLVLSVAAVVTTLTGTMLTETFGGRQLALLALIVASPRIRRILDRPGEAGAMTFTAMAVAFVTLVASLAL